MVRSKLPTKRARNVEAGEGSSRAPPPPSDHRPSSPTPERFREMRHALRYDIIKTWSIIKERRVELLEGEYTEFWDEIVRRKWQRLAEPDPKYDPQVVYEFYANAIPDLGAENEGQRRSWVRGKWVPYDRMTINSFLGNPLSLRDGAQCQYYSRRVRASGFSDHAIAQVLCREGLSYEVGRRNVPTHILRKNMTYLAQAWMTFILSNVIPSDHNSDLSLQRPFGKALVVASILRQLTVDVAQLISDSIHQFVMSEPVLRSSQPKKSLGFPSLITALCDSFDSHTFPTFRIRPPITRSFIVRNCYQGYDPQHIPGGAADPPPPPVQHEHPPLPHIDHDDPPIHQDPPPVDSADLLQRLSLDIRHLHAQQAANHRGQLRLYSTFHDFSQHMGSQASGPFPWPPLDDFSTYVAWPGDSPIYPEGAAAEDNASESGSEEEEESDGSGSGSDEDEDMVQPSDDVA